MRERILEEKEKRALIRMRDIASVQDSCHMSRASNWVEAKWTRAEVADLGGEMLGEDGLVD